MQRTVSKYSEYLSVRNKKVKACRVVLQEMSVHQRYNSSFCTSFIDVF
jgi:hypothetical protein